MCAIMQLLTLSGLSAARVYIFRHHSRKALVLPRSERSINNSSSYAVSHAMPQVHHGGCIG